MEGPKLALEYLAQQQVQSLCGSGKRGIGVDIELISDINIENDTFIERNFTRDEQEYCWGRPNPHASFAGKWCAKEAVIKAVSSADLDCANVWVKGSAAPLIDIEICSGYSGAPQVVFHGEAKEAVEKTGVTEVKVSISHIDTFAIATAIAQI
ncbi:fatty acid synthase alpha subunit Lsd1 [Coemansia sp. RSA 1694]|nr:fatty acid synthase alpha subunit Lsd1 [Coemansia sp. RSA 1694]